jgi:hypothetical protein
MYGRSEWLRLTIPNIAQLCCTSHTPVYLGITYMYCTVGTTKHLPKIKCSTVQYSTVQYMLQVSSTPPDGLTDHQ